MSFFDIQVNGYAGVDFNQDNLSEEDLHRACSHLQNDGVDGILATIITAPGDKMVQRIKRIIELRKTVEFARDVIAGIHVEGPFINPKEGYRGAHPEHAICAADQKLAEQLVKAGEGQVRIFTLAPEQDEGNRVTRMLAEQGITVAAGHTNATIFQLETAIDAGLSMVTHLGNGCPSSLPRHDNIVQRVLYLRKHLWISFIADGVHIPFPTLRNYLDLIGPGGKCLVTTDAMSAAGLGPGTYRMGHWSVVVGEAMAARSPDGSHLVGSAVSMLRVAKNLAKHLGVDAATVNRLTNVHPRQSIKAS